MKIKPKKSLPFLSLFLVFMYYHYYIDTTYIMKKFITEGQGDICYIAGLYDTTGVDLNLNGYYWCFSLLQSQS